MISIGTGVYQGDLVPDNKASWNTYYLTNGLDASMTAAISLN